MIIQNLDQQKNFRGRSNMNRHRLELLVHGASQTMLTKIHVKCFSAENVPRLLSAP